MGARGLPNPERGPQHLLPSSLKNNPSIRSQFGDKHFLQRCSLSTHPLPGAPRERLATRSPKQRHRLSGTALSCSRNQ